MGDRVCYSISEATYDLNIKGTMVPFLRLYILHGYSKVKTFSWS